VSSGHVHFVCRVKRCFGQEVVIVVRSQCFAGSWARELLNCGMTGSGSGSRMVLAHGSQVVLAQNERRGKWWEPTPTILHFRHHIFL
jgi:hypothetical protein